MKLFTLVAAYTTWFSLITVAIMVTYKFLLT